MSMKLILRFFLVFIVLSLTIFMVIRERGIYTFWHSNIERLSSTQGQSFISNKDPLIIDARTLEEYKVSHLNGAVRFNENLLDTIPKQQPLLIYCTVGVRSNSLANQLTQKGFTEVFELKRGILGWKNADLPLMNNMGQLTDEIHVYNEFFVSFLKRGKAIY